MYFFLLRHKKKKMGIDEILEARFRHILEQDRWIPDATVAPSEVPLMGGGDDSRKKWIGCLLLGAAAVGLLAVWCRR